MTALPQRQLRFYERRNIVQLPEDGHLDVLPMLFTKHGKKEYRNRLYQRSPHCRYCGRKIAKREDATVDHLQPESRDGQNTPWNLVLSCPQCNNAKGARTVEEWVNDILHGAEPCDFAGGPSKEGGAE